MDNLTAPLIARLQSSGFRPLSGTQLTVGPFAARRGELRLVRLDSASFAMAFVSSLETDRDAVRLIEELNWDSLGYDLNMGHQAHLVERIDELRLVLGAEQPPSSNELTWRGYRQTRACWVKTDPVFPIPVLDDDFTGEIFPCLGWVPCPGALSEFSTAEQRRGFCSKVVPEKAEAIYDVRGYRFVHAGYAERPVLRRQILVFVEKQCNPARLIDDALALTYGDA